LEGLPAGIVAVIADAYGGGTGRGHGIAGKGVRGCGHLRY
jgi:hypothetical protein